MALAHNAPMPEGQARSTMYAANNARIMNHPRFIV
jgi:hypothetical protein